MKDSGCLKQAASLISKNQSRRSSQLCLQNKYVAMRGKQSRDFVQITAFIFLQDSNNAARQKQTMQSYLVFSSAPPSPTSTEMTGEVHICSSQVVVGVQIEAMIYDMCCKQSVCISQGPVTAPAPAVKGSVRHSLILHLGHNSPAKTRCIF